MKLFSNLTSLIILLFALYYLIQNPEQLNVLSLLNPGIIISLIFLKLLTLFINSNFNKVLLKSFSLNISNRESLYLGSLTFLGNLYLPARSGGNLRMLYLNRKYKFKTPELASMYLYFFIVTIFLNSLIGIICLFLIYKSRDFLFYSSITFFIIMFVISSFLTFRRFNFGIEKNRSKPIIWLINLKKSWNKITSNSIIRTRLIFLTLLNYLFFALEAFLLIGALFSETNLYKIFYYNSLSVISSLASFTPASIGIKDSIIYLSGKILDLNLSDVIGLMIAERALLILFSIIPASLLILNKRN